MKHLFPAPGVPQNSVLLFLKPFLPSSSRSLFSWFPLEIAWSESQRKNLCVGGSGTGAEIALSGVCWPDFASRIIVCKLLASADVCLLRVWCLNPALYTIRPYYQSVMRPDPLCIMKMSPYTLPDVWHWCSVHHTQTSGSGSGKI